MTLARALAVDTILNKNGYALYLDRYSIYGLQGNVGGIRASNGRHEPFFKFCGWYSGASTSPLRRRRAAFAAERLQYVCLPG